MARILIVEDNLDLLAVLQAVLSVEHEVTTATRGPEGLERAVADRPDLVLLDIGLPELSGIEVGRRIKRELGQDVPILVLSALAQAEDERDVLDSGCCDAYLAKPATLDSIREHISKLLERGAAAR